MNIEDIKRTEDLPERYRMYKIILFNGNEVSITPAQKAAILKMQDQFIQLPNGEVLNKSAIERIVLDKKQIVTNFYLAHPELAEKRGFQLPDGEINKEKLLVIKGKDDLLKDVSM